MDQPDVESLRSRLAAIADSSNDVIISKNLDGVISTWNLSAQRLFGYSEADRLGFDEDFVAMGDELTNAVGGQSGPILENLDLLGEH